jgi:hypothetical protein
MTNQERWYAGVDWASESHHLFLTDGDSRWSLQRLCVALRLRPLCRRRHAPPAARRQWHDPHQPIVDGTLQGATIGHKFNFVPEHVRNGLSQMLAVAITALAHHVPEQDGALKKIDLIIQRRSDQAEGYTQVVYSERLRSHR